MNKKVVVIGASGHGKVVADIIKEAGDEVAGFLDDNPEVFPMFSDYPVLGTTAQPLENVEAEYIVAIGNAKIREMIVKRFKGVKWYTAVHPTAVLSKSDTAIGEGTVIMPNAVINAGAKIGKHCIINTSAVVEHDNKLEDYVHVSVGAKLAGTVCVGKSTWIGIGACISNNLTICGGCMIGAGAVVVKDIKEAGTYIGVPARKKDDK